MSASPKDGTERFVGGAVVVAAGRSTRMQGAGGARKPWIRLAGRSLLEHASRALLASEHVAELVLVVHGSDLEPAAALVDAIAPDLDPGGAASLRVVEGGAERIDSVANGVAALERTTVVAVHDAARPLVLPADVTRTLETARDQGAALLAEPVVDTLKRSEDGVVAQGTVDREGLWKAQTPQAFDVSRLRELIARARGESFVPTDEASLWERYVGPVPLVEGSGANFKITRPGDLELAEALLALRSDSARGGNSA